MELILIRLNPLLLNKSHTTVPQVVLGVYSPFYVVHVQITSAN